MPFTLSHPVAAWAFARTGLPVAAVVAGTVVPDVPLFARSEDGYTSTHSLLGIVTWDLALGLVAVALWLRLVRDPLVDLAPAFVRDRLAPTTRFGPRRWALVPVGVVVGAVTHVGWDEFTHVDRWGYRHVGWLRAEHAGWAGYHWAQAVSSVAGLLGVAVWAARWLGGQPRRERPPLVPSVAGRSWAVVAVVGVVVGVTGLLHLGDGVHAAAFAAAVVGVVAAALAVLVVAAGWWLALAQARRSAASAP